MPGDADSPGSFRVFFGAFTCTVFSGLIGLVLYRLSGSPDVAVFVTSSLGAAFFAGFGTVTLVQLFLGDHIGTALHLGLGAAATLAAAGYFFYSDNSNDGAAAGTKETTNPVAMRTTIIDLTASRSQKKN